MAYEDVDPTLFQKRFDDARQRATKREFFKPKVGPVGQPVRNMIRILPPHPNMGKDPITEGRKFHFSLGPAGRNAIMCLAQFGEPCAACAHVKMVEDAAAQAPNTEERKRLDNKAYSMRANWRFFCSVVEVTTVQTMGNGVQPYAFGPDTEKSLRACYYDDAGNFRNISHPVEGRNVIMDVSKKPKTDYNQYDLVRAAESATPLANMAWLEHLLDLPALYMVKPTAAQVHEALTVAEPSRVGGGDRSTVANLPPAAVPPMVVPPPVMGVAYTPPPSEPLVRTPAVLAPGWEAVIVYSRDQGFDPPFVPDPVAFEATKKPPCYTKLYDPKDSMCQTCKAFVPCGFRFLTAKGLLGGGGRQPVQ